MMQKFHKAKKSLRLKHNMFARAKKSLGQNFLKSKMVLEKIVAAGEISKNDVILEIGPGKGSLTEKLLEKAGTVVAVEKDRELFQFLQEKFKNEVSVGKLILIEGDILQLNVSEKIFSDSPQKFSAENFFCPSSTLLPRVPSKISSLPLDYKIIANIPYNITGAILKKFLQGDLSTPPKTRNQPSLMVLMVQYEVAKRIISKTHVGHRQGGHDGKESLLSISVKTYGTPKMIMKVPARYFSPKPKVDSAIISIKNISKRFFEENKIKEEIFWQIVHAGFAHKRKKLSSNLKKLSYPIGKTSWVVNKGVLENLKDKRAEDLPLSNWASLIKKL